MDWVSDWPVGPVSLPVSAGAGASRTGATGVAIAVPLILLLGKVLLLTTVKGDYTRLVGGVLVFLETNDEIFHGKLLLLARLEVF